MKTNRIDAAKSGSFIKTDWECPLPESGYEVVTVLKAGDYVYAATNGRVYQLDKLTGTVLYQNFLPKMSEHEVRMAISKDNKRLVVGTFGHVTCLDAEDISIENWTNPLKGQGEGLVTVICDSRYVYAATDGIVNQIELSNGASVVKNPLEGFGNGEIRLALSADEKLLVAGLGGKLACLKTDNIGADLKWKRDLDQGAVIVNVLIGNEVVYAAVNGYINAVDLNDGTILQTNEMKGEGNYEIRLCLSADLTSLYGGFNGKVVALDVLDMSKFIWTKPLPGAAGKIVNLVSDADSNVYAGSSGKVFRLEGSSGTILETNDLPGRDVNEVRLSLAENQTNLYIGTSGFAIGTSEFGAAAMDKNNWMQQMGSTISGMQVKQMLLPGTHDSGSYGITPASPFSPEDDIPVWLKRLRNWGGFGVYFSIGQVTALWAKAQGQSVYEQLMSGIRYFDLRLSKKNEEIWISHSLYSVPVDEVLSDVQAFVHNNPQEIIMLDFSQIQDFSPADHDKMVAKLQVALGTKMANKVSDCSCTVNDFWTQQQQFIVFYKTDTEVDKYSFLWPESSMNSPRYEPTNVEELIVKLTSNLKEFNGSTFSYLHGQLTPDDTVIINGLNPIGNSPSSLMSQAKITNPEFMKWVRQEGNKPIKDGKYLNVIASDWVFTIVDFVSYCIIVNKARAEGMEPKTAPVKFAPANKLKINLSLEKGLKEGVFSEVDIQQHLVEKLKEVFPNHHKSITEIYEKEPVSGS